VLHPAAAELLPLTGKKEIGMTRKAYTVGDRFHFPGDWQTSEGTWEVVGLDDDLDQIICKPISGDAFKEEQWQRK
jgi:hypothetical protein